jgi:hypothetical protein
MSDAYLPTRASVTNTNIIYRSLNAMKKTRTEAIEPQAGTATAVLPESSETAAAAPEPALDAIDALFTDLENQEQGALQDYAGLAVKLAQGESVDPQEAREILLAARKLPGDLQQRVERLKRMFELRDQINAIGEGQKTRGPLDTARAKAIEIEKEEARELQTRHGTTHGAYMAEIARLDRLAEKSHVAGVELAGLDRQLAAEIAGPAAPAATSAAPRPHQLGGFSFQSTSFPPVAASSAPGVVW